MSTWSPRPTTLPIPSGSVSATTQSRLPLFGLAIKNRANRQNCRSCIRSPRATDHAHFGFDCASARTGCKCQDTTIVITELGAIFRQTILAMKCSSRIPRGMPFLGGGNGPRLRGCQVHIFSPLFRSHANWQHFWRSDRGIYEGFTGLLRSLFKLAEAPSAKSRRGQRQVWKSLRKAVILGKVCFGLVFFRLSRYSQVAV
jgi:hypothetical protein